MNRYRFRLEPVLRVRRIEQDTAQAGVVAARRDFDAAESDLHRSVDRYRARPETHGPSSAAAWLAGRAGTELTAATVIAAGTRRELAAGRVAEQQEALQAARRRVAALERLDERRREEHALAAQREEATDVDELVTSRHGRTP